MREQDESSIKSGEAQEPNKNLENQTKPASGKEDVEAAHRQADTDIAQDADLSIHNPNDDLDEAETARLGENKTGLV
jgi:hypothetical protein